MYTKSLTKIAAVLAFSSVATLAQAVTVTVTGNVDNTSGALAALVAPNTPFSGSVDMTGTVVNGGQVLLAGFCFTDDASGLPPTSGTCGTRSAVPFLVTGATSYDGTQAPAGSTFEQAGSNFDSTFQGGSGDLELLAFSPTFNVNLAISLVLNADGTGTLFTSAGALGTADGGFTWVSDAPPVSEVPVPAAAWLFGSALVGLAGVGRKRKLAK